MSCKHDKGGEPSPEQRDALEADQRALLAALVAHGDVPLGFVEHRVAATRSSLKHKRLHETCEAAPALGACLGARFGSLFSEWARDVPPLGGPRTDAQAFARSLPRELLDRSATREMLAGEVRRLDRPAIRARRLGGGRGVGVAVRLPGGRLIAR